MPSNFNTGRLFSDKIDSDEIIKKLVDLEKSKADKWENDKFLTEIRKKAWEGLQKKLKEIDTAAKSLYNPLNSPFRKMKSKSSNEDALDVTATKSVRPGDYNFKILKLASSDSFRSDVLERSSKLPAMKFEIALGDKTLKCNFRGGSLDSFVRFLNERAKDILTATLLKVEEGMVVISIEGKKTGAKNKMVFRGDLEALQKIGLLQKYTYADFNVGIEKPENFSSEQSGTDIFKDNSLVLSPKNKIEKIFATPKKGGEKVALIFKIRVLPYKAPKTEFSKMQNAKVGFIDKVWVGDIDIKGEPLLTDPNLGSDKVFKPGGKYILTINYKDHKETVEFPLNRESTEWQDISITLKSDYINGIVLENPLPDKDLYFKDMKIVDESRKGFKAKNALRKASDAIIEYKGIKITRPTNDVDDLVPGMTIKLKETTKKKVKVHVDWNYDQIQSKIFELIVMYNNAMDYIKNITKATPPKNQKQMTKWRKGFEKMTAKEAEDKAKDGKLYEGVLNGQMSLSTIKMKLRSVMMKPYQTTAQEQIRFITQIGIQSPKYSAGSTSEEDRENLRAGYLEFNKEKFENALKKHYLAINELFFKDSNGDLKYDEGLAIEINKLLKLVASDSFRAPSGRVQSGMIRARINMLKSRIRRLKRTLTRWERHVDSYERQLRMKFARMHKATQRAKEREMRIRGFSQQNSNR